MIILHCRTHAAAKIAHYVIETAHPSALTTRTGKTVRTDLSRTELDALRYGGAL